MRFQGKVWRHIPAGSFALHVGRILGADGRWNRVGVYGCLYTALTQKGAIAEWRKTLRGLDDTPKRRDVVSIVVDVSPIVDLTDPASSPIPPNSPFLTGDTDEDLEQCRQLADTVRSFGYVGILAPSAALPGAKNLIIYIDGPASAVSLEDGGNRTAITRGP
ncbi:MAG TPA: RES family NAD+ phosphorylase [Anaerolineales bacterium]|nr:RES family NAD+ phosphorylase [Anaerolineales bacterium]